MKKLLSAIAVGLLVNVAVAGTGFDWGSVNPIEIPEGGTVDVYLLSNAGTTGGMSLYAEATNGFMFTGLAAKGIGGFWTDTNTTYENLQIYDASFSPNSIGPFGVIGVGAATSTGLNLPEDVKLAKLTVSAAGLPVGWTGTLTTSGMAGPSTLSAPDGTGQATVGLVVTPEPTTALLLLGALPLLRRRR